jgi:hypothetical protein
MLDRGMIRPAVEDASHAAQWSDSAALFRFQHEAPNVDHLLTLDSMTLKIGLVIRALRSHRVGLELRDRKHRLRTVKLCFSGSDFVDWLANNLNLKRSASCSIGRWLLDQAIGESVGHERGFVDSAELFYRWLPKSDDASLASLTMTVEQDSFAVGSPTVLASRLLQRAGSADKLTSASTTTTTTTTTTTATASTAMASSPTPPISRKNSSATASPTLGQSPLRVAAATTAADPPAPSAAPSPMITSTESPVDESGKSRLGRSAMSVGSSLSSPRSVWSRGTDGFETDYGLMPSDTAAGYTFRLEAELAEYSVMPSVDNIVSDATAGYDKVPEQE